MQSFLQAASSSIALAPLGLFIILSLCVQYYVQLTKT